MRKSLLFIIISMAFLFMGVNADAQDTKNADPQYPLLDKEAVKVIKKSPKWKPAKKDGRPVKVSYTMPVMFNFK